MVLAAAAAVIVGVTHISKAVTHREAALENERDFADALKRSLKNKKKVDLHVYYRTPNNAKEAATRDENQYTGKRYLAVCVFDLMKVRPWADYCFEIKSSAEKNWKRITRRYWNGKDGQAPGKWTQWEKDLWIMARYKFPILLVWMELA
jgi:hypothetical protein